MGEANLATSKAEIDRLHAEVANAQNTTAAHIERMTAAESSMAQRHAEHDAIVAELADTRAQLEQANALAERHARMQAETEKSHGEQLAAITANTTVLEEELKKKEKTVEEFSTELSHVSDYD